MDLQVSTEMSITLGEDGMSMEVVSEEQLYCICQTPWDVNNRRFMIHCDHCQNWFHGDCVGITEKESHWIDSYSCSRCEKVSGPSKYKPRSEFDGNRKLMNKRYSPEFRRRLKEFCFLPSDEIIISAANGTFVKVDQLVTNGFFRPIVVDKMDGLGLRIPPHTFTVNDIERYLDSDRIVDVIDVEQQTEFQMTFREFSNYFTDSNRQRLLNLISLEVSNTRLGNLIEAPNVARKLDFLNKFWPESAAVSEGSVSKPAVSKYCLISAKDSYTDFHIDFGGTSVWYHILWGQKIFYLIEPTKVNLDLYNQWLRGDFGKDCFLPDEVQQCYRCVLDKGQTLFIPTGWIHAVYTPHDSLVFGGNFLHELNMGLQLQIHSMERKSAIASKYLFPLFETTHWYAAKGLAVELNKFHRHIIPPHILQGVRDLVRTLKAWITELQTKKNAIPIDVDPHLVVKQLSKEIRLAERFSRNLSENTTRDSPRHKRAPLNFQLSDDQTQSSIETELGASIQPDTTMSDISLGSPDAQIRIKMKISRKSMDEWSPSPHTSELGDKNSSIPSTEESKFSTLLGPEVLQRGGISGLRGNKGMSEEDSRSSFDCLYIDETTMDKNSKRWDTDTSVPSSESHRKNHHKDKKSRKHHHRRKHKKRHTDSESNKHRHKSKGETKMCSSRINNSQSQSHNRRNASLTLNDALAGALDGMEELIKSSNYAERVAQSHDTTDAVKETVVGLGAMTNSILAKGSQTYDADEIDIKPVHQDDDYIYLPLVASDDESTKRKKKKRSRDDEDETWCPSGKLGNVGSRNAKTPRQNAKRKAVEKGLEEAASRPVKLKRSQLSSPKTLSFKRKPNDSHKKKKAGVSAKSSPSPTRKQPAAGTSTSTDGLSSAAGASGNSARKWKKGMQTPKQRLSKILKMGKFFNH